PWRYARCWAQCRREVADLIVRRRIDLVFAALPFSWVAATPVVRRLGLPIVWRAGGTESTPAERRILSTFCKVERPDLLVCNGDAVGQLYRPLVGAPTEMIRNGVDDDQFRPGAGDGRRLRPPGARVVVGFAGRLVPQK